MVGHLAIGPDLDAEATAGPGEPMAIERIVAVLEKDALAPVAPLGHTMRQAGDDDAGDAGHAATLYAVSQFGKGVDVTGITEA